MGQNKIDTFINEWTKIQGRRLANMKINQVRIQTHENSYYGRLDISIEMIHIIPDDSEIAITSFDEFRLNGVQDIGSKGIQLNQRLGKPITLYFRTTDQRDKALTKIKILIGEETTSESSASSSSESTSS